MKFRPAVQRTISAIRFYKGSGNTGTQWGTCGPAGGQQLATVNFTGETATGWQQANLASPVTVTAGTTYVASYYAPVGRYAEDEFYFQDPASMPPDQGSARRRGRPQWRLPLWLRRRLPERGLAVE